MFVEHDLFYFFLTNLTINAHKVFGRCVGYFSVTLDYVVYNIL